MFAPENIVETARQVVEADAQANREDPAISHARATLVDCERKISRYLDGLEAGIPADVIAARIASARREKEAAQAVLAGSPPAPEPLAVDEVVETLTALRDLPELLGTIDQADRAALYQTLRLRITYRRVGDAEELKLKASFQGVDLERVGGGT